MKKAVQVLLAIGGIIGGILGSIQLYEYFNKESVIVYDDPYIPLVYVGAKEFRDFLDENKNRKVQFDTQISFDAVLGVSMLIHEACNYDGVLETIRDNPENISSTDIGLIRFNDGFVDPENNYTYNTKKRGRREYILYNPKIQLTTDHFLFPPSPLTLMLASFGWVSKLRS